MNPKSSFLNSSGLFRSLGVIALFLALPLGAQAQTTVEANADAYIRSGGSNTGNNFGDGTLFQVKGGEGLSYARKAIFRFDFSGAAGAAAIDEASISLTVLTGNGGTPADKAWEFALYGLNGSAVGQDWMEGTGQTGVTGSTPPNAVVWNNAPGNNTSTSYSADAATTTLIDTFTITGRGVNGSTVTISGDALNSFLSSIVNNSQVSFLLVRTDSTGGVDVGENVVHQFATRENGSYDGPMLTYTANIPEASDTALLAGLLVLCAVFYRRFKASKR